MATSLVKQVPTTFTDYGLEAQNIERQRKMAEMLSADANHPLPVNRMVGNVGVPISWSEGLAQALKGYRGAEQMGQATDAERALGQRYQAELGTAMGAIGQAQQSGDKRALLAAMLKHPETKAAALQMMLKQEDEKFGTAPHYETDPTTGKTVAVQYGDRTTRKVIGPATPLNQFTATTADSRARLDQAERHWSGLSADQKLKYQFEGARLNISGQELFLRQAGVANESANTQFNTGGGAGVPRVTMPTIPQVPGVGNPVSPQGTPAPIPPQGGAAMPPPPSAAPPVAPAAAPQPTPVAAAPTAAPVPVAPQGAPVLTPRARQEIAVEGAKLTQKQTQERAFTMGGLSDTLNKAEDILRGRGPTVGGVQTRAALPTSSLTGSVWDTVAGTVGSAPKGAAEADQLKVIGANLVMKMPRMQGPQSDKDVALYKDEAGNIGDNTLPIARRLSALQTVRELYAKYDQQPRTPGGAAVLRFDAQGNPVQ